MVIQIILDKQTKEIHTFRTLFAHNFDHVATNLFPVKLENLILDLVITLCKMINKTKIFRLAKTQIQIVNNHS